LRIGFVHKNIAPGFHTERGLDSVLICTEALPDLVEIAPAYACLAPELRSKAILPKLLMMVEALGLVVYVQLEGG